MIEAYVLAAELTATPDDHTAAFARYQHPAGPAAALQARRREGARVGLRAPQSACSWPSATPRSGCWLCPRIPELVMGRSLRDAVELPAMPVG